LAKTNRFCAGSIWLFPKMNLSREKGADQAPLGLSERALGELEAAF
jgi:hypothetical protein